MKTAIRSLAVLLCVLLLTGCQLNFSDILSGGLTEPASTPTPETRPTHSTQPVQNPVDTSLQALRSAMGENSVFGAAYFGYHDVEDSDEPIDPRAVIKENAPLLVEDFPFLLEIPDKRVAGGNHGDLICIVPRNPNANVRVSRCTWNGDDYIYDNVVYESNAGDPVFLFCNHGGIEPDTQVVITDPDGTEAVWYPTRDNNQCLMQLWDDDGFPMLHDFSPYREMLLNEYIRTCSMGWWPADDEILLGTWWGLDIRTDGSEFSYEVTFYEDYTADIYWYDGETHEYLGAEWRLYEKNEFPVLAIDLGGLAGVRKYNVLWEEAMDTLYLIQDISGGTLQPGMEPLERFLQRSASTGPVPEDMIGTWNMAWTEVEGDVNEVAPGVATIEIWQDAEGTFRISYTNRDFPRNNFTNKTLEVFGGEMYAGCGNDSWVADVGFIGPGDTFFAVTVLEDGTLLMQTYWEMEGQMWVSYAWFTRM